MVTRPWDKNANNHFCSCCHEHCWSCCYLNVSLKLKDPNKSMQRTFFGGTWRPTRAMTWHHLAKAETRWFPIIALMEGVKQMYQLAEHLRERAVLPLNQPKKPVSVVGTSRARSLLAEQASCFHRTCTGRCAGTTHYSNFHSLGRGTWALEGSFWWSLPSSSLFQQGR